ncbi:TetR/AcrR family transcriptional regulator [Actinoallomurus rhizosphaericola]|uniref:TetR/AcrR family transcriptional regulator n=1 Tax=Actinoallomurus rhizosphaericola TaxID=2952536 RepID=UPI002093B72C|nr:TetR/AcrR family transcriptional regulator [Actinoallomurus rhizosphaericola]MCO5996004.1 TetR/AcrR family transcriptional regulator [Actinoallomurus rhizosphaericola]
MTTGKTSFPTRRAAAERNREKILASARAAFADGDTGISMAEVARRAGVGMATLYRNFPGRRELLEALYADEVDAICEAAVIEDGQTPGEALTAWLRLQFDFIPNKRLIVSELLEHADQDGLPSRRGQALDAGRPLLTAAQDAREIRDDLTLEQIFDLIVAIAKIPGSPDYLEPMIQTMLDGLRLPADKAARR